MNPYISFLVLLVAVPYLLGFLYSILIELNPLATIFIFVTLLIILLFKLAIDKRRATESLWKSRAKNQTKYDGEVDLSVIVPAYNEEQRLPKMLDEALTFLESRRKNSSNQSDQCIYKPGKFNYEIIIVDDGSKDGTTKCGNAYSRKFGRERVRVVTLAKNRGKGGAVREGVLSSRGKYVIFADADGASRFADIEKLEEFMYENRTSEFVIAIGSRAHMEEQAIASRSLIRTILMKGFHLMVWLCCVRTVRDTQCGFKMFDRKSAQLLFPNYHNESWAFDVELLYLAEQIKCKIGEIAINWEEIDGSKIVPVFSWIRMGWDVICLSTLYNLGIYRIPSTQ